MAPSIEKQRGKYHERTNKPKWNRSTRSVVAPKVAILYGLLAQSTKHAWTPIACRERRSTYESVSGILKLMVQDPSDRSVHVLEF